MRIKDFSKYFHTLRYLKAQQVSSRILRRFKEVDVSPVSSLVRREPVAAFLPVRLNKQSLFGGADFVFLNEAGSLSDWNDPEREKLWLYNLHYFDDLNSHNASDRYEQHAHLIDRWINENPPIEGNGWEPYPMSLRIVNWVKWLLVNGQATPERLESLALQAKALSQSLETHLLGNHLFANAKALVFAGLFFQGKDADDWLALGLRILKKEIPEQVLSDGGNFELTPMYHSTITADFLDLISIFRAFQDVRCSDIEREVTERVPEMLRWLSVMTHTDGLVTLFNDAAIDVAPTLADLSFAAEQYDLKFLPLPNSRLIHMAETGFFRLNLNQAVVIGDIGKVGPDYIPGHAHADTLSFELSVFGSRLIVNGGTSQYGADAERHRQRSTAAHSTVEIDSENSSEVWGGFRVARRAFPIGLKIDKAKNRVLCGHNGYARFKGSPLHWRTWTGSSDNLVVTDRIEGKFHSAVSRFHLHPDVSVKDENSTRILLETAGGLVTVEVLGSELQIEPSIYCPEFGKRIPTQCISIPIGETGSIQTTISWRKI